MDFMQEAHVILSNQREKCIESRAELRSQSIGKSGDEITGRRNKDRIIFSLIFGSLIFIVLIRVLLTERLLFQDLDSDVADFFEVWQGGLKRVQTETMAALTIFKKCRANLVDRFCHANTKSRRNGSEGN
jgi:hypothetical protein